MAAFGFSVGDFVDGVELVRQVISSLKDSAGSSKEYQDLIHELYSLKRALLEVKHLNIDETLGPQKTALEQAAIRCQDTISQFLLKIEKYQPSLRAGGSGSSWRDRLRKIQWTLYRKEDVRWFRAQIQGHTSSIMMMLTTIQLNATTIQASSRISNASGCCTSHQTQLASINQSISNSTNLLQAFTDLLPILKRITSNNGNGSSPPQGDSELSSVVKEVRDTNLEIYRMVLNMQTALPPQVERQQPVYLLDACGFRAPFHLEFIKSWEAFIAVLNINFKARGLHIIEKKRYVLEDAHSERVLDPSRPWESCFFPGRHVNMDALFDEARSSENSCPVCQHLEPAATDQAIDCSRCGTHYRRIEEVDQNPLVQQMGSPPSLERTSEKLKADINVDAEHNEASSDDDTSQFRRIRLRGRIGHPEPPPPLFNTMENDVRHRRPKSPIVGFADGYVTSISRPVTNDEHWTLYYFEIHARNCKSCFDPLGVAKLERQFCSEGHELAVDVARLVFLRKDVEVYSREKEDHKEVRVELPYDYSQCLGLLKAIQQALKKGERFINPNPTPYHKVRVTPPELTETRSAPNRKDVDGFSEDADVSSEDGEDESE